MSTHITTYADGLHLRSRATAVQGALRRSLLASLSHLQGGAVRLIEGDNPPQIVGQPVAGQPPITVQVHAPLFYEYACLGGSVGLGEAFVLGLWTTDDLVGVSRLFLRNLDRLDALDNGLARLRKPVLKFFQWRHRNSRDNSRVNIAAHYDLGNAFFKEFLDHDMNYSSAMYRPGAETLEAAQERKLDTICRKLDLQPGEHLVEIGTGWGAMAIHAARHYGVKVTTTTISREQYDLACAKVQAAGLQDQITVLLKDYRELDGQYDKAVSVEMIEAVGDAFYSTYLGTISRLLKPEGQVLIQAITCSDQRYAEYSRGSDFIRRYIFPGGHLPSITRLLEVATRHTDLRLFHLEDFSLDYARTLADWRERFWDRATMVREQGYSEAFMRMWDYYLGTCEAAFAEHVTGVVHLLMTRPGCRRDAVTV